MNVDELFKTLPPGWLSIAEARLLHATVEKTTGDILEVGSFRGRSTVLMAHSGRKIFAVDKFVDFATRDPKGIEIEKQFLENTKPFDNVMLFKMAVEDWTPRPCGFAYLDGDHSYKGTLAQIKIARQCSPTYVAVHDVNDGGGGKLVKRACIEQFGKWEARAERLAVFKM